MIQRIVNNPKIQKVSFSLQEKVPEILKTYAAESKESDGSKILETSNFQRLFYFGECLKQGIKSFPIFRYIFCNET